MGSLLVLLLLLIATVPSVKHLVRYNQKARIWLFRASTTLWQYFWGNYLVDVSLLSLSLCSMGVALGWAADPVHSFYLYDKLPHNTLFLRVCAAYALSVVAGNYCLAGWMEDALTSQLLVLLANVSLVCAKLFLDQYHASLPYQRLAVYAARLSPTFAFVSACFRLFSLYSLDAAHAHGSQALRGRDEKALEEIGGLVGGMWLQGVAYVCAFVLAHHFAPLLRGLERRGGFRWGAAERYGQVERERVERAIERAEKEEREGLIGRGREGEGDGERGRERLGESLLRRWRALGERGKKREGRDSYGVFPEIDADLYRLSRDLSRLPSAAPAPAPTESTPLLSSPLSPLSPPSPPHGSAPLSPATATAIDAKDLAVAYPASSSLSLDRISLHLSQGERVAVLGLNGSGKTSLFQCLSGLLPPSAGTLQVEARSPDLEFWDLYASSSLSYVPQEGSLPDFLTVRQALSLLVNLKFNRREEREAARERLGLRSLSLAGSVGGVFPRRYLDFPLSSLSGGSRKKAEALSSLLGPSSLLLLDEVTTGVDPLASSSILSFYSSAEVVQSLVLTSHRVEEALALCERVVLLGRGRILLDTHTARFRKLAFQFYQVDVVVSRREEKERLLSSFPVAWERVVEYGERRVRVVCEKDKAPLSLVYGHLEEGERRGGVERFGVRGLEMEEMLTCLMLSLQSQHRDEE
jgi:ABC-type multidrug transport system ATPase subunit